MAQNVGWKKARGGYTVWLDKNRTKKGFVKVQKNGVKHYYTFNSKTKKPGKYLYSVKPYTHSYGSKSREIAGRRISAKIKLTKPKIRIKRR